MLMTTIKSTSSASTVATTLRQVNGEIRISVDRDGASNYQGNTKLASIIAELKGEVTNLQEATEKYASAIQQAHEAYKATDRNSYR